MKIQPDKKGDQFLIGAQDSGLARSYVKLITQNNEIVIVIGVYGEWKPVKDSDGNPIILEVGKTYTIKACNVYNKFPDPNLTSSDPDYPWRFYNYFSVEVWDENNENKLAEGYYRWTSASDRNQHKVERSASSLYLFWENHPNPSGIINNRFYGKMYYCDIYVVKSEGIDEEGNSFIEYEKARHFIPVVVSGDSSVDANPEDVITVSDINGNPQFSGKPGMYNDIELEGESAIGFYVNSNTDATFDFYYE